MFEQRWDAREKSDKDFQDKLLASFGGVRTELSKQQDQLKRHEAELETQSQRLATIDADHSALSTGHKNFERDLQEEKGKVASMDSQVQGLLGPVATLQKQMEDMQIAVAALQAKKDSVAKDREDVEMKEQEQAKEPAGRLTNDVSRPADARESAVARDAAGAGETTSAVQDASATSLPSSGPIELQGGSCQSESRGTTTPSTSAVANLLAAVCKSPANAVTTAEPEMPMKASSPPAQASPNTVRTDAQDKPDTDVTQGQGVFAQRDSSVPASAGTAAAAPTVDSRIAPKPAVAARATPLILPLDTPVSSQIDDGQPLTPQENKAASRGSGTPPSDKQQQRSASVVESLEDGELADNDTVQADDAILAQLAPPTKKGQGQKRKAGAPPSKDATVGPAKKRGRLDPPSGGPSDDGQGANDKDGKGKGTGGRGAGAYGLRSGKS